MLDKSLMVMIFMYSVSFAVLTGQYVLADSFGITLQAADGTSLESHILDLIREGEINEMTASIVAGTYTDEDGLVHDRIIDFNISAAYVAWELVQLLSGTYIFNLLYVFGVPIIIVTGIVTIYLFLMARTIIGLLRGLG